MAKVADNEMKTAVSEPQVATEEDLTPEQKEKIQKAAEKKAAEQARKKRAEYEKNLRDNLLFYTRTVPAEMALAWLTEGAKKDLGVTMDAVVLFNYEKGNLSIGLLPAAELEKMVKQ